MQNKAEIAQNAFRNREKTLIISHTFLLFAAFCHCAEKAPFFPFYSAL